MKKVFVTLLAVVCIVVCVNGKNVDVKTAQEIGQKFINANTSIKSSSKCDLAYQISTKDGNTSLYVFNIDDKGFVVVSGDDIAIPILGYSTNGIFNTQDAPIALMEYLGGFDEAIQNAKKANVQQLPEVATQWNNILANGSIKGQREDTVIVVAPLVSTLWNQSYPYNKMCPMDADGSGGHCYTGCTSTAMAMIIEYWEFPRTGQGSHSYTPNPYPQQTVNYGQAVYNYDLMLDSLNAQTPMLNVNEVAQLLWHCGVSINSSYGTNGTSAQPSAVPQALKTYYKYDNDADGKNKNGYSTSQWVTMLKADIDNNIPIHYSGWNAQGGDGHSFICDGYDSNDFFHFNWGWAGSYNGYYAMGAMIVGNYNFSYNNYAIFDIYPPEDSCSAPLNLMAVAEGRNIVLSWDDPLYSQSYQIYCNGEFVGQSQNNTYTLYNKPNGSYIISVRSTCKFGESDASNQVSITLANQTILGDANDDSVVDITDIQSIVTYLFGFVPRPFIMANADVNGDNIINILDVVKTSNIIMNK